jgi:hypothetical protein
VRPFVIFYGGKWALARRYGPPQREHVVEPFGGFAGFSTFWEPRRVTLVEKDEMIVAVWRYLQRSTAKEIMSIPTAVDCVDDLHHVPEEAKWLVGWWFNRALVEPARKNRSHWAGSDWYRHLFWGVRVRHRIASQLEKIRDWTVLEGSYEDAPDVQVPDPRTFDPRRTGPAVRRP